MQLLSTVSRKPPAVSQAPARLELRSNLSKYGVELLCRAPPAVSVHQEKENVKLSCTMSRTLCLAYCVCLMSPTRRRMKSLYTVPHAAFRSARQVRHKPMVKSGPEDDCWEQGWTERRIWDTEFSITSKDGFNCQLQLRRLQY
jgi:hypothetical protein